MKTLTTTNMTFSALFALIIYFNGPSKILIYFGALFFGACMSTLFPLALSVPTQLKMKLIHQDTSKFVLSGAFGEMVVPVILGYLIEFYGPFSLILTYFICALIMFILYKIISSYLPKIQTE
jgi:fucose permease